MSHTPVLQIESERKVIEQLRVQVSWLTQTRLKGDLGAKRTMFKDKERVGVACPIAIIGVLDPSVRVMW